MFNMSKIGLFTMCYHILSKSRNKIIKINLTNFSVGHIKNVCKIEKIININEVRTINTKTVTYLKQTISFDIKNRE